ncbi:uncharacterized protein LOC62_01G000833 [Vanrija pseudolonga]|uniref:Uncharacterized protein n=1 Tax=Vanrija pseudolonga TaxID=143232 RepID=A0AAF0Y400_9TREE|nr:hypothetical protein LOC62_01G000833 [Vanrija pseudolonga]
MSGNNVPAPAPAPEATLPEATMPKVSATATTPHPRRAGVSAAGVWAGLARFWDAVGAVRDHKLEPTPPPPPPLPASPTSPTSPRMALFNPFARSPPATPLSPVPPVVDASGTPASPSPEAPDPAPEQSTQHIEAPLPLPADTLPPFHAHVSLPCAALLEQHRDDALPALLGDIAAVQELCVRARRGAPGGEYGAFGTGSGHQAELRNLERTARSLVHLSAGVEMQLRMLRGLPPCIAALSEAEGEDDVVEGGTDVVDGGEVVEAHSVAEDGAEGGAPDAAGAVPAPAALGADETAPLPHDVDDGHQPQRVEASLPTAVDVPAATSPATVTVSVASPAEAPTATPTSSTAA